MPIIKIRDEEGNVHEADVEFHKLKGYSKFYFVAHKEGKHWCFREFYTGCTVHDMPGSGNFEQIKRDARAYLKRYTDGDATVLQARIDEVGSINDITTLPT